MKTWLFLIVAIKISNVWFVNLVLLKNQLRNWSVVPDASDSHWDWPHSQWDFTDWEHWTAPKSRVWIVVILTNLHKNNNYISFLKHSILYVGLSLFVKIWFEWYHTFAVPHCASSTCTTTLLRKSHRQFDHNNNLNMMNMKNMKNMKNMNRIGHMDSISLLSLILIWALIKSFILKTCVWLWFISLVGSFFFVQNAYQTFKNCTLSKIKSEWWKDCHISLNFESWSWERIESEKYKD